jgi:hypothetical protein
MTSIREITKPMRHPFMFIAATVILLSSVSEAATLNKCIDAKGNVTYSNLPCRNARETQAVEIDPPPKPEKVKPAPAPVKVVKPVPARVMPGPTLPAEKPAAIRLETQSAGKPTPRLSARQCDSLTDKLGKIFDQMDQARRSGYTQEQMDKWNREAQELETKKQQSGCF